MLLGCFFPPSSSSSFFFLLFFFWLLDFFFQLFFILHCSAKPGSTLYMYCSGSNDFYALLELYIYIYDLEREGPEGKMDFSPACGSTVLCDHPYLVFMLHTFCRSGIPTSRYIFKCDYKPL